MMVRTAEKIDAAKKARIYGVADVSRKITPYSQMKRDLKRQTAKRLVLLRTTV